MTKFSHTILAGLAVCAAVLSIAACGSSSKGGSGSAINGWTPAKVAQAKQKINSAINQSIGSVTSSLPAADKTKLKTLLATYVNCSMAVIEPNATPAQAFSNTYSKAKSLETQVQNKCQKPLQKGAESLVSSGGAAVG